MDASALASWAFRAAALGVALGVPLRAARARGRSYAIFAAVVLGVSLPGLVAVEARLVPRAGAAAWLVSSFLALALLAAGVHFGHLVRARLRGPLFRWTVSVPGMAAIAAGFLAGLWLLALLPLRLALWAMGAEAALEALVWLDALPIAVAALSVLTSLHPRVERVEVELGSEAPPGITRLPVRRSRSRPRAPERAGQGPLRIVQVTDPHLGPWQPVARLRGHLERLLEESPDLVLLTGDFLTMEGQGSPGALARALEPLRAASGRCYAVFGNHDHEAPDEVRSALADCGADLLMDDARLVDTRCGPVQIVGADYRRRERAEHLGALLTRHPRVAGALRLLLLHDPSGFRFVPPGEVDLTLSGHTHGGQIGLVSLGLDWTVLRRSAWPDHGLFAHGVNRLYVHRGTGFYGFPLRVGVPGELSVLEVRGEPFGWGALPAAPVPV